MKFWGGFRGIEEKQSLMLASLEEGFWFVVVVVLCGSTLSVSEGLRVPDSLPETDFPR